MIIKTKPKKSAVNKNKIQAEQQNVRIRNKTECIGFADKKTKQPHKQKFNSKKKCKLNIKNNKFFNEKLTNKKLLNLNF
jgi:hypothetical protein